MTHEELLQLLSAQVDGELAEPQQAELEAHFAENPDDRILAEAFRLQDGELRESFEPHRQAAAEMAKRVAGSLPAPATPAPTAPLRSNWAPWAFSSAIAVLIGLLLFWKPWVTEHRPDNQPTLASLGISLVPKPLTAAPKATELAVGDRVETAAGQRSRLKLVDGSILFVNENSSVTLSANRQLDLQKGEIFLAAIPANETAAGNQFKVTTGGKTLTALGTKFSVAAGEAGPKVQVTQGAVEVSGVNTKVLSGQMLTSAASEPQAAPRAAATLDWTRELMTSADAPLVPGSKYSGGSLIAVDPYGQEAKLSLVKFQLDVHIEDGFARTTIDQTYFNSENFQMEGTFYFPLPPDASLSRLAMYVDGNLMEGGMAEREHARQTYERIRYQRRDPALLEWLDGSLFKMRVFPLEARQEKRILLSYTQRLPESYGRLQYRFPAGHSLNLVDAWSLHANVVGGKDLLWSSPSHPDLKSKIVDAKNLELDLALKNARLDRDVVLEFAEPAPQAAAGERVRWSTALHEGDRYLMLRYRPDMKVEAKRERRDWAFLFESSGSRDPLLARTQIEIARALLNNAEHEDTFSVLTAGTRVTSWRENPQPVNSANVAEAIKFLEQTHLIGALNLEEGLRQAGEKLRGKSNPHLVHLGSGIAALGEQRADLLVKQIPADIRYVGIAVGKRFAPQLMRKAAEKSGGYFTQINPDEPIAWRGFELASTLNTPRLMDLTASVPGQPEENPPNRFLGFAASIVHGEEFAAVCKLGSDPATDPRSVRIHGTLNGGSFEKTIAVDTAATNTGHLPRTWAKLEIERLLAENAAANRERITSLSMKMYVMTPYTSLLVLENERMYEEFKVDRGRKDHWAMYPAPQKIDIVYKPDPNQPATGSGPDLQGRKPHRDQVMQSLLVRSQPPLLTWSGRDTNNDQAIATATSLGRQGWGKGTTNLVTELGKPADMYGYFATQSNLGDFRERLTSGALDDPMPIMIDEVNRAKGRGDEPFMHWQAGLNLGKVRKLNEIQMLADLEAAPAESAALSNVRRSMLRLNRFQELLGENHELFSINNSESLSLADREKDDKGGKEYFSRLDDAAQKEMLVRELLYEPQSLSSDEGIDGIEFKTRVPVTVTRAGNPNGEKQLRTVVTKAVRIDSRVAALLRDQPNAPRYYSRPSFSRNERVYRDLLGYAPGLSTSPADTAATLEAEAAPKAGVRRGSVDPKARAAIDRVRAAGWRQTEINLSKTESLTVRHNGSGSYQYERVLPLGLVEKVFCDGESLWHVYPELGLAATRAVSRFHRAELLRILPDQLPPADDFTFGRDVKQLDDGTIALIPVGVRDLPADHEAAWLETHLVLEGDRLVEQQLLLMPKKEMLSRTKYETDGTVRRFDEANKEIAKQECKRTAIGAPKLLPETADLVVLPLPLRDRSTTYRRANLDANYNLSDPANGCIEYAEESDAIAVMVVDAQSGRNGDAHYVWQKRFAERGDTRKGFLPILLAGGYPPSKTELFHRLIAEKQDDPLVRFLAVDWQMQSTDYRFLQEKYGLLTPRDLLESPNFLHQLACLRALEVRWSSGAARHEWWGYHKGDVDDAIRFVRSHLNVPSGRIALTWLQDMVYEKPYCQRIGDAWGELAARNGDDYSARYEQARAYHTAELGDKAEKHFKDLYAATLKKGFLPPVDGNFRTALLHDRKGESWPRLMKETAAVLIEKKLRPLVVRLAWQCSQLGDHPLAEILLDTAFNGLAAASDEERLETKIAAIEYLWSQRRHDRVDELCRQLLDEPKLAARPQLWRLAGYVAQTRGNKQRETQCLEIALELEFAVMPTVFNVQPVREDYLTLLNQYQYFVTAAKALNVSVDPELAAKVVRAADRWRALDTESEAHCSKAAEILRQLGDSNKQLAWDYLTTPLDRKPNESDPWLGLANNLVQHGEHAMADQCFAAAFAAEPTNAEILWNRAQHLRSTSSEAESRKLLRQLADTEWQPRFDWLKTQARQLLEGR